MTPEALNTAIYRLQALERTTRDRWTERVKCLAIGVAIISALGIVGAIDIQVKQAEADERAAKIRARAEASVLAFDSFMSAWHEARERDYRDCPPPDPARPTLLVQIIENISDRHEPIRTCFRIPQRRP